MNSSSAGLGICATDGFAVQSVALWLYQTTALLLLLSLPLGAGLLPWLESWSKPIQERCLALIPKSATQDLSAAIVCGRSPPPSELLVHLRNAGILHLLVVSGAHLIWLQAFFEIVLRRISPLRFFIVPGLGIYALAAGANPPIIRALVQIGLHLTLGRLGWRWPATMSVMGAGVLTACIFPAWLSSWSLFLSWNASLVLASGPRRPLLSALQIFLVMAPPLSLFSSHQPISILGNLLLAPLVSAILFPLTLASVILPGLTQLTDLAWRALDHVLTHFIAPGATSPGVGPFPRELWLFTIALHGLFLFARTRTCDNLQP